LKSIIGTSDGGPKLRRYFALTHRLGELVLNRPRAAMLVGETLVEGRSEVVLLITLGL
jgi:hypothetical protein